MISRFLLSSYFEIKRARQDIRLNYFLIHNFEPATFGLEVRRPIYTIYTGVKTTMLGYES